MSVRESLLAILDQGPNYGYQLRIEYVQRTGTARPLNVGQVYTTLDRLERDGLVGSRRVPGAGHVEYAITERGHDEVQRWLRSADLPARDEFALKLALAMTLPGVDPTAMIAAQRSALRVSIDRPEPKSFSGRLVAKSDELRVAADLEFLEHCEQLLASATPFATAPPRQRKRA